MRNVESRNQFLKSRISQSAERVLYAAAHNTEKTREEKLYEKIKSRREAFSDNDFYWFARPETIDKTNIRASFAIVSSTNPWTFESGIYLFTDLQQQDPDYDQKRKKVALHVMETSCIPSNISTTQGSWKDYDNGLAIEAFAATILGVVFKIRPVTKEEFDNSLKKVETGKASFRFYANQPSHPV